MEIVIFGSGNVAWSLGHAFHQKGHNIMKVVSRNEISGLQLAKELSAEFALLKDCDFLFNKETVCFLCFPDDVLSQIASILRLKDYIVVHTAGSVSINVLKSLSDRIGVFYPLQTLKYGFTTSNIYPILIDALDQQTFQLLKLLASTISNIVEQADDTKREKLHLAAVIVNNFVNHLFTLTSDFCKSEKIDFNLLMPLIQETIHRIESDPPSEIQTGPAKRNDLNTIKRHQQLIENFHDLKSLYSIFSESILSYYNLKNKN